MADKNVLKDSFTITSSHINYFPLKTILKVRHVNFSHCRVAKFFYHGTV